MVQAEIGSAGHRAIRSLTNLKCFGFTYPIQVLALLFAATATARALDRDAFTFTAYNLDVRIEPAKPLLAATGKLILRNDSATPQRVVTLQISSTLDWKSILVAGKRVQYLTDSYTSDIDHTGAISEAVVTLPREVAPKGTIEIEIGYQGAVPQDATRLERIGTPREIAAASDWDRISESFTALRGAGYVAWYPVSMESASLSEGNEYSEILGRWKQRHAASTLAARFWVTRSTTGLMPAIVSSAACSPTSVDSARNLVLTSCKWTSLGSDQPVVVAANYAALERPAARIYHFNGSEAAAGDYANVAASAVPLVTEWLGELRRPITIAELPAQMTPFEAGTVYLTSLRSIDVKTLEVFLTHQLAHAALVSSRTWVSEGVANFLQALQRERQEGRMAAIFFLQKQLPALIELEKNLPPKANPSASGAAQVSNATKSLVATSDPLLASSKGMYVWWMLRDMVGDRVLQNTLRKYRAEDDRDPSYTQRLLEAEARAAAPQAAAKLEQFFDDWVYRDRGLPDFHIASVYARQMLASGFLLTVTVENPGGAGAEVPVIARAKDESVSRRLWVPARGKASIRIPLRSQPVEAQVNDGSVPESNMKNNTFEVRLEGSR
jgi:hypothetical protein